MNVTFDVSSTCHLALDVTDVKQAFQFIAYVESIFGVDRCGNCESGNLQLSYRQPKGYDYYSVVCKDCHHEFKFGHVKESGRLFPKGWEPPFSGDNDSNDSDSNDSDSNDSDSNDSGDYENSQGESGSQEPAGAGTFPF